MAEARTGDEVEVILDVFSGRPNPRWTLTEAEAGELAALLSALPAAGAAAGPRPPDLGYRGFRIEGLAVPGLAGPHTVYGGAVAHPGGWLLDPGRTVERRLLESAAQAAGPGLLSSLRKEIEGA